MTVYVTIETEQGNIAEVGVFRPPLAIRRTACFNAAGRRDD
jgi:hypothetical protein